MSLFSCSSTMLTSSQGYGTIDGEESHASGSYLGCSLRRWSRLSRRHSRRADGGDDSWKAVRNSSAIPCAEQHYICPA